MKKLKIFIEKKTTDYLILDGLVPTISLGLISEELILYNIPLDKQHEILKNFNQITGKNASKDDLISELSHGQKLILSALLALRSNANKIAFRNFFTSISKEINEKLKIIIEEGRNKGKIIEIISET